MKLLNFNESDRSLLLDALEDLSFMLRDAAPSMPELSSALAENTSAISSTRRKLRRSVVTGDLSLSAQELKVLYWAVSETRNDVREFLGEASLTDPDREAALETQRACNRLLRGFAAAFSQNGIDIRSLFGP